jgi:hypothetical protein
MGGMKGIVQWAEDEDQPCRQSGSSSTGIRKSRLFVVPVGADR